MIQDIWFWIYHILKPNVSHQWASGALVYTAWCHPLYVWNSFDETWKYLYFLSVYGHCDIAVNWYPSSWKAKTCLSYLVNLFSPGQNGCQFADDIFKWIFMNVKLHILIRISLKFVSKGQIDNKNALVQVMAWCWIGDKPFSEPIMTQFP